MTDKPIKMAMMPSPAGEFIRDQVLEALDLSISKAAKIIKIRRATLSNIINGKSRLNTDTALRLEKAFGVSMELLLRIQTSHEVAQARKFGDEIDIQPYQRATG